MKLTLTPALLARAYDYLCATEPFVKWKLPPSDVIKFSVYKRKDRFAHYECKGEGLHYIKVSSVLVGSHASLLSTMAHEMLHLHMNFAACLDLRSPHGEAFNKLADKVCKVHGFDRKLF